MSHPRTKIERAGADRARTIRRRLATDIRGARQDAGLSLRRLSRAAGVSHATVSALERGTHDPSTEVLARVGEALGMDLSVRLYPGTGPLIRDHLQAAMIEVLLRELHERWRPSPEVWVTEPVRGVIDLVLEPDTDHEPLVAMEAQSELRRLEQQIRWAHAKAEALAQGRGRSVSRLLLLRSTRHTRAVSAEHAATLRAAYPALARDAHAALTSGAVWPGPAVLWADIARGQASVRHAPPRSITIGR
jgi:transcriptional regulator with XRE-family HTH domain